MRYLSYALMFVFALTILSANNPGLASDNSPIQYPANRPDLKMPDNLWDQALENVAFSGKKLGYSYDEMTFYGGSDCVLPYVENLFRDVSSIPRSSGRLGDLMLENPEDIALDLYLGYSMLGTRAGRGIEPPKEGSWGVDWIEDGASTNAIFNLILRQAYVDAAYTAIREKMQANWQGLPENAKILTLKVLIAMIETAPYVREAFDEPFLVDCFDFHDLQQIPSDMLYEYMKQPWQDDESALVPKEAFDALHKVDFGYLAYSSQMFTVLTRAAIDEYLASEKSDMSDFTSFEFATTAGVVGIYGPGDDEIPMDDDLYGDCALIIDLGGNDTYSGKIAVPQSFQFPIGVVIDLGGNDKYISEDKPASLACGNHGIGALYDLSGDDIYRCSESGIASAMYGTGILVDYSGNDNYHVNGAWGEGAAHAGVAILADLSGDDYYWCGYQSQGFGGTYGVGILLDVVGNDQYIADPEGSPSEPFQNNTVSFAQGTGYGRRADFGDGHSLGGGVGVLVDASGDDSYAGGVYCQGAGYWWSIGILEDRSGNDSYSNVWYSLGSAPHFAIGCCVDFSGNDKYNVGNDKLVCQTQGCARDGSIALFIDGSGDDEYYHTNRCAGSGDLNSIAMFWDRCGDDYYKCNRNAPYVLDLTYGDAPYYPPFGTFHDDILSVGLFFDTGGTDIYEEIPPTEIPDGFEKIKCTNDSEWNHKSGPRFYGYGVDVDYYLNEAEKNKEIISSS